MIAASFVFYAAWDWRFVFLLAGWGLVDDVIDPRELRNRVLHTLRLGRGRAEEPAHHPDRYTERRMPRGTLRAASTGSSAVSNFESSVLILRKQE